MVVPVRGSVKTQAGIWLCQTRVWPRTRMPLAWAKATCASALVKVKLSALGSVASHFMSFSEVRLLKCFFRRSPCTPAMVAPRTAAPTGKRSARTSCREGRSGSMVGGGRYVTWTSSMEKAASELADSTYRKRELFASATS